jgi:hypothetical protein
MSLATAHAPETPQPPPEPVCAPQKSQKSVLEWLRTWEQVLVAEILNAMERRKH